MQKLIDDLSRELIIFNVLSTYSFEFGILDGDNYISVPVDILNPDETITKIDLPLKDVMYFTENGTISIPARPALELTLFWAANQLDLVLDEICTGILEHDWTEQSVFNCLQQFQFKIENYAKIQLQSFINSGSYLSSLINIKDDSKYIYDLNKLKNFIKCKIIRK